MGKFDLPAPIHCLPSNAQNSLQSNLARVNRILRSQLDRSGFHAVLEGYVFYSTLYGRSPERSDQKIKFGGNGKFPSDDLDQIFREIAWQTVQGHPSTGVTDKDGDGLNDSATKASSQRDSNSQKH